MSARRDREKNGQIQERCDSPGRISVYSKPKECSAEYRGKLAVLRKGIMEGNELAVHHPGHDRYVRDHLMTVSREREKPRQETAGEEYEHCHVFALVSAVCEQR